MRFADNSSARGGRFNCRSIGRTIIDNDDFINALGENFEHDSRDRFFFVETGDNDADSRVARIKLHVKPASEGRGGGRERILSSRPRTRR